MDTVIMLVVAFMCMVCSNATAKLADVFGAPALGYFSIVLLVVAVLCALLAFLNVARMLRYL